MCFGIIYIGSNPLVLAVGVVQIPGDIAPGIILEQLRIGPLHSPFSQERFRRFPRPAQALEQEERFGKLLPDPRLDELPNRQRHFVAGIAAKAIAAQTAA